MKRTAIALTLILALLFSLASGGQLVKLAHAVLSVSVVSPQNTIYTTPDIFISIKAADPEVRTGPEWLTYSLDDAAQVTIVHLPYVGAHFLTGTTTLHNLSDGLHSIVGYAYTWFGQSVVTSPTVKFVVDTSGKTQYPNIRILSPESRLYNRANIQLDFAVTETDNVAWMGYSLDSQANATITGNTTLNELAEGSHRIEVYLKTNWDSEASSRVNFTVDTTPPNIKVTSPKNLIYNETTIRLDFTINESTAWMGYCLDEQSNVTITGNSTIEGLSESRHLLRVYANDTAGNTGASEDIDFTVAEKTKNQPSESFPTTLFIAVLIVTVMLIGAGLLVYRVKFKKQLPSEQHKG